MNDIARQEALRKIVKCKFRGHKKLNAKGRVSYPDSLVREYKRITNSYMALLNRAVSEYMPEIKAALKQEQQNARADALSDLWLVVHEAVARMSVKTDELTNQYGLERKLNYLAGLTVKLSIKEWKKVVKSTLGIDLLDDYYLGEFYRQQLQVWVADNVSLIKSIPQETLANMQYIVLGGFRSGKTTTSIIKEIRQVYGVGKRKAQLIARDQMAKLNADIARSQQEDAGVREYTWRTSGDSRVRERHRELNGKVFSWDNPPVVDLKTGRRCHPGQDYQCRCVAIPKFDIDTLDLPLAQSEQK